MSGGPAVEVLVALVRGAQGPLRMQLEEQLRAAVRDGMLAPGTALPSTRALARELGVSRGMVVEAYDQLAAEGYVTARQGAPTRVADAAFRAVAGAAEPATERAGIPASDRGGAGHGDQHRPSSGPDLRVLPLLPGPLPGVVRDTPGWYWGDLHCHTIHSSDAWASGTAMTPSEWAKHARELGLDFLCMTDHNTIAQNWALGSDAGVGVLLMAGEEMTNNFHGHATVIGLDPGEWLDFRQSPFGLPLPTGGRRIQEFIAAAREMGAYVAAAHPLRPTLSWQFLADGAFDPAARTDGLEVWNGPWQVNEEMALRLWDYLLGEGWDVVANGGSDLHGLGNTKGYAVGLPTTVVYATALSRDAIVDAVQAGRSFVTRQPNGVEIYLTATGSGGQETYTGGTLWGDVGELVTVRVLVRRAAGMRLSLRTETGEVLSAEMQSDEQTIEAMVSIGAEHSFVRAEIRTGQGRLLPVPQLDMEAFTNPIRLQVGDPPAGTAPEVAPPSPPRP